MTKQEINLVYLEDGTVKNTPHHFNNNDVVISDNLAPEEILNIIINKGAYHVVQQSSLGFETYMRCAMQIVKDNHAFVRYPISVITGQNEPNQETENQKSIFSKKITDVEAKQSILNELIDSIKIHTKSKGVLDDIRLIADELLTNAIYNAPFIDRSTGQTISQLGRDVVIDPLKQPVLFAGLDDKKIVIGCTDFYGSLNLDSLTQRIYQGYVSGTNSIINHGLGGAGLGTYLVFNLCNSYYLAVEPEKMTTVCCTIPRDMSNLKRAAEPKNFSMIKIQD